MSDTHGLHRRMRTIPSADLVIHAGDFSTIGTKAEALDFIEWFCDLPHRHKVFIAGNHDTAVLGHTISGLPDNCHYLEYNSVTIEGIKVYGMPFFWDMGDPAEPSELDRLDDEREIDLLVSHQPPYGVLDYDDHYGHYGSIRLLHKCLKLKPKYHVFGHIHQSYGQREEEGITFINAALLGTHLEKLEKKPILINL